MKDLESRIAARIEAMSGKYFDTHIKLTSERLAVYKGIYRDGAKAVERIHYLRGKIDVLQEMFNGGMIRSAEDYFANKEGYESELNSILDGRDA